MVVRLGQIVMLTGVVRGGRCPTYKSLLDPELTLCCTFYLCLCVVLHLLPRNEEETHAACHFCSCVKQDYLFGSSNAFKEYSVPKSENEQLSGHEELFHAGFLC